MEYTHVITDAITGEVTVVPFTEEEVLQHQANAIIAEKDPVEKLKEFLLANPDVANILNAE
jgi:hypothetical protein